MKFQLLISLCVALAAALVFGGCQDGGGFALTTIVSVEPNDVVMYTNQQQQFDATVTGAYNTAVTWSASAGSITQTGLYTAPSTPGTYYVTATSVENPNASDTVAVVVQDLGGGTFAITPTQVTMLVNNTQQFDPIYSGLAPGVTWEVQEEGGGTIDENGLYTAPNEPGTYHVIGTSTADPSQTATAVITVNPVVAVSVSPEGITLVTGAQQQLEAAVTGTANTAVTWTTTGGNITQDGLYTAPGTPGTYYVTATSIADPSKSDTVAITVNPVVIVSVSPDSVALYTGAQQQFDAIVTGTSNTAVTWEATGGSINSNGLYTAPGPGTYYVTATSVEDPSKSSTAEVVVTSPPPTDITISPTAVTLDYGETQQFTADLVNLDPGVTWKVDEGTAGGTITSTGLYTAPTSAGTYHVIVTSTDDPTKTATATITVEAPIVTDISITPSTVILEYGATQQFAAILVNLGPDVTWKVDEGTTGGTITSDGLYTAPNTTGTYHVTVTSNDDSEKSATATISVVPPIRMFITPKTVHLSPGETKQFKGHAQGATNPDALDWSVLETDGGTISDTGLYTAPMVPGTYHVVVASAENPKQKDIATVVVDPQ